MELYQRGEPIYYHLPPPPKGRYETGMFGGGGGGGGGLRTSKHLRSPQPTMIPWLIQTIEILYVTKAQGNQHL